MFKQMFECFYSSSLAWHKSYSWSPYSIWTTSKGREGWERWKDNALVRFSCKLVTKEMMFISPNICISSQFKEHMWHESCIIHCVITMATYASKKMLGYQHPNMHCWFRVFWRSFFLLLDVVYFLLLLKLRGGQNEMVGKGCINSIAVVSLRSRDWINKSYKCNTEISGRRHSRGSLDHYNVYLNKWMQQVAITTSS